MFRKRYSPREGGSQKSSQGGWKKRGPSGRRRSGGQDPFQVATMKQGRRKQTSGRPIDVSLFVRKAIQTTETTEFHPEHRFEDFHIHEKLKNTIRSRGYEHPTPIQDGSIPHILKGRDVIGIANTGTGKTAAFLLPLINKTFLHGGERVLILVPTRELALQIEGELKAFSVGMGLRSVLTIGGTHIDRQIRDLRRDPHFVIGTPGRVKDLIERKELDLSRFANIVLDEVDRMLDMGFVKDIKYLLSLLPEKRQSLFFSATLEKGARDIAEKFIHDPITVAIRSRATSENVDQDVIYVESKERKIETLHELLLKPEYEKSLIFCRTKFGAAKLARSLKMRGFQADAIHGDLSQGQRQRSLRGFREGHVQVLVATDVAARGLDIEGISHVINYDIPATYEDYIHRIGRTGRGRKSGTALTFVDKFVS